MIDIVSILVPKKERCVLPTCRFGMIDIVSILVPKKERCVLNRYCVSISVCLPVSILVPKKERCVVNEFNGLISEPVSILVPKKERCVIIDGETWAWCKFQSSFLKRNVASAVDNSEIKSTCVSILVPKKERCV